MNEHALLKGTNCWKIYGEGDHRVEALRGIEIEFAHGEIVAIMGPSGCGKTTLLNCLATLDMITKGNIYFQGQEIQQLPEGKQDELRAGSMGFVFQSYNLIPVLTALENVEVPLLIQNQKPKEARERAMEMLTRVGLRDRANHFPSQLSGGQSQRVALARALANRPSIIWADEPTGALDRETSKMVLDLIDHIHHTEQTTIVMVTHDPAVAERADRILYMDSGRIVQERYPKLKQTINRVEGDL